jgi:hypothetical protein
MVLTRAQSKTTAKSTATAKKPAAKRSTKAAAATITDKTKPKPAEKEDTKPSKAKKVEEKEAINSKNQATRRPASRATTKAEPKAEPKASKKVEKAESKPATKSSSGPTKIVIKPESQTKRVAPVTETVRRRPASKADPEPKTKAAKSSRLGNPIKPKRKGAAPAKKEETAVPTLKPKSIQPVPESIPLPPSPVAPIPSPPAARILAVEAESDVAIPETIAPAEIHLKPIDLAPPTPLAEPTPFKLSHNLSPTKSLGSPIKAPVSARPIKINASPKRSTPMHLASLRKDQTLAKAFLQNQTPNITAQPVDASQSLFKTSGLSPFKSLGTPIRRALPSSLFPSKLAATAAPPKRFASESPWRPRSAHDGKRVKLSTPQRPRTAEDMPQPSSCLRDASKLLSAKKTVSFQSPSRESGEGSPKQVRVSKFALAPPTLPRLSEGQESETTAEPETEVQPLALSEVLNVEFTPEPSPIARMVPKILKNVRCYVDVWDSSGVSANQLFVPLLQELGAAIADELTEEVTHVLFKDGNEKTLRRVARSNGSIKCVNVGWPVE